MTVTAEEGETDGGETGGGETDGGGTDKEEAEVPEGITTFVFDGNKVTVVEGADTNYGIVDKAGDDVYTDNGDAESAVIKAKDGSDVTIGGTGTLIVNGNGKNGIKAATKLTIEDVNLSVTAPNNAIASDTEMTINSGTISVESGNDGIKSSNDDAPIGSITIEGGDITVNSTGDCIVATIR